MNNSLTHTHKIVHITEAALTGTALDAMHAYLGDTLNRVVERKGLEEHEVISVPLLSLPDVIIFPGETIPLRIHDQRFVDEFSLREVQKLGMLYRDTKDPSMKSDIGIVVSIRKVHVNDDEVVMTAIGRNRFKVLNLPKRSRETSVASIYGTVQILPDYLPIKRSFDTFSNASCPDTLHVQRVKCPYFLSQIALELFLKYQSYNDEDDINDSKHFILLASEDPVSFVYQACSEMPLTNEQSMELLGAPTIVEILHLFIRILQKKRDNDGIFVCSNCNRCLACVEDMATIAGAEGRIGAYVNPHGIVYIRHIYTSCYSYS